MNVCCSDVFCASYLKQNHKHNQLIYYVALKSLNLNLLAFFQTLMLMENRIMHHMSVNILFFGLFYFYYFFYVFLSKEAT